MKIPSKVVAWPLAAVMLLLRATCRVRVMNDDPRPRLKRAGVRYIYSTLHANQIALAINTEPNTAAMVSRSGDGDLLIPGFKLMGIVPIRGSSQNGSKSRGGREALDGMIDHVTQGSPAILAVDGPRGPRGKVRKGIAVLSHKTGATVLNVVAVPSRRWILRKSWDRLQIPLPFSRVDAWFAEPIAPRVGEGVEAYRKRIEESLNALEAGSDPGESWYTRGLAGEEPAVELKAA